MLLAVLWAVTVVATEPAPNSVVVVHKCCNATELMFDNRCTSDNSTSLWAPMFSAEDGRDNVQVAHYQLVVGPPNCGPRQQWPIYHFAGTADHLKLLSDGRLRHYIDHKEVDDESHEGNEQRYYDYAPGMYCLDKNVLRDEAIEAQFALVCTAEIESSWKSTDFLMRRVVNPVCHGISIICFLTIAVVYFVVPQLRDLVGNIITTVAICLIVNQAADMVMIFTQFSSHVSFIVAEVVMYVSLLGAFLWLNSLGFYIWKTFRSRNVFLRITDGRKYCYYSVYAWLVTGALACVAMFAHFMLDKSKDGREREKDDQDAVGWLGIAMFFTPICFTILINIFFYLTTAQAINRMSTYGRIHHKMKYSFEMFVKLFLVMTVAWLFLLMSWLRYNGLYYSHIVANALQAPLVLYICVLSQRRVTFLLRKSCCYEGCPSACCRPGDPSEGIEWGEEMMAMNTALY